MGLFQNKKEVKELMQRGTVLLNDEEFHHASFEFEKATLLDPKNVSAWHFAGAAALALLNSGGWIFPDDSGFVVRVSGKNNEIDDPEKENQTWLYAHNCLLEAEKLEENVDNPEYLVKTLRLLADMEWMWKQYEDALKHYQKLLPLVDHDNYLKDLIRKQIDNCYMEINPR